MGVVAVSTHSELITDPAAAAAFGVARSVCLRHAPDLYYPTVFLSKSKRNAICAVYGFVRLIRSALLTPPAAGGTSHSSIGISCCSPGSDAQQVVTLLRQRLCEIYEDRLDLPLPEFRDESQHVLYAFSQVVRRYSISQKHLIELIDGYRLDATIARYATWAALEQNCRRTGGVLGLITGCVLGVTHSDAGRHLAELGIAIRLSQILRELPRDLRAGRLYLPLEDLARFRVTQRELSSSGDGSQNVRQLLKFEVARARQLYREGAEGICWLAGDGSRLAASAFLMTSSAMLGEIEKRDYALIARRPNRSNGSQTLRRLGAAWRLARRKPAQPVPDIFK